jgi:predicted signal transduction protein with EAL and GGDEF domain
MHSPTSLHRILLLIQQPHLFFTLRRKDPSIIITNFQCAQIQQPTYFIVYLNVFWTHSPTYEHMLPKNIKTFN